MIQNLGGRPPKGIVLYSAIRVGGNDLQEANSALSFKFIQDLLEAKQGLANKTILDQEVLLLVFDNVLWYCNQQHHADNEDSCCLPSSPLGSISAPAALPQPQGQGLQ